MAPVKRDPDLWRRSFVLEPIRRIQRAVHERMLAVAAAAGYPELRLQHLNVFALVPRDEGLRMSELAEALQVTPGAATQIVQPLEQLGLVERVRDPNDGRATIVRPTPAAEAGYEAGRRFLAEVENDWAQLVGRDRFETFKAVLTEIAASEQRLLHSS